MKVLFVAIGGAAGSVLRYLVGGWVQKWTGLTFPLGTMLINISGCFAIGILATLFTGPILIREEYRVGLLVGVIGGFTTFSSFSLETNRLADDSEWFYAALYVGLSVVVGLLSTWAAIRMVNYFYGEVV